MDAAKSVEFDALLENARHLARLGQDEDAKKAYVAILQRDPTHFGALTDLAGLALATGYRSAAITAYRQAIDFHPDNPFGLVNLANVYLEDENLPEAKRLYEAAIAADPALAFAHQGLASVLAKMGDAAAAKKHLDLGFKGHSIVERPYRGDGVPLRVLLIVSVKGGNIPTNVLLDDHIFAVTALYAEYHDAARPLPAHDIVFNAIGDADLCVDVLDEVARICERTHAPIVNRVDAIRGSGRCANAQRLSALPDVIAPRTASFARGIFESGDSGGALSRHGLEFPLLLRTPGYHTGMNFVRVENADGLADAARALPGEELLAIQFLDARGRDGLARKYRVMFIGGVPYPLHLALSHSWKVHYFTSSMADDPDFRSEEEVFLNDPENALGKRAMRGLTQLRDALGLDYGGADFAVAPCGRLLLFEANATMAIVPPAPEPVWDYRRAPIACAIKAAQTMLFERTGKPSLA